jgi:mono/diheme cytochrome c family protein/uncharacterized membrane protein
VGTWLGGLVVLAVLFGNARRQPDNAWLVILREATQRFSLIGEVCVAILLATGIVNAWYLVGTIPALLGTPYGHLLLIKVALFGIMVALAAKNRFRWMPRLGDAGRSKPASAALAIRSLRRNALVEAALGLAILVIVSSFGTMPPALHDQPWWPLPWRPSLEAMQLPDVFNEVILALVMTAIGISLCIAGVLRRRYRLFVIPVGLLLVVFSAPSFGLLTIAAYPTTFASSPAAYTTQSIAHGSALYGQNCASCHGVRGKGDGPGASALDVPPADLTAAHVLDHTEGDIFWWLTAGIPESGMPGFAGHLSEAERWDLVNFVRTLPVGGLDNGLTPSIAETVAPRAPDFSFDGADGQENSLQDRLAQGPLLLVLFSPSEGLSRLRRLAASRSVLAAAGLRVLAVPLEAEASGATMPDIVGRADPSVAAVYRLIATARSDHEEMPRHLEFLIDRDGNLRALWRPDLAGGWNDLQVLQQEVDRLKAHPLAPPAMPTHMNMHMG